MTRDVVIAGTGIRAGRPALGPIERAVREAVEDALAAAGRRIGDVDFVVTVGSELLDGTMIATRSGIAGAWGREILTVPSSGGHAFAAAVSMIESGAVDTVLLAGWGEGTKFGAFDARYLQADPFHARPLGADASALGALQAQRLLATGRLDATAAERFGGAMRERAGIADSVAGAAGWLAPCWRDGACALLLAAADEGSRGVRVCGVGVAFEPYCPDADRLDPADWLDAALAVAAECGANIPEAPQVIEIGGPTPFVELAALARWCDGGAAASDMRVNACGGSAASYFGPATGLQPIAVATARLRAGETAVVADLAGPIGQATTAILLEVPQ